MDIKNFKKTFTHICDNCGEFTHTVMEYCESCGSQAIRKATSEDYLKIEESANKEAEETKKRGEIIGSSKVRAENKL